MPAKAIIVGISVYRESGLRNLPAVDADLSNIRSCFERHGIEIIKELKNVGVTELFTSLREACLRAKPSEDLIVYFSGHGQAFNNRDFLMPTDATVRDIEIVDKLLVPVDLGGALQKSSAASITMIIDACRDGVELNIKGFGSWSMRPIKPKNGPIFTIYGCGRGHQSFYISDDKGSIFTTSLCEAIENAGYGLGSVDNVIAATQKRMKHNSTKYGTPPQTISLASIASQESKTHRVFPDGTLFASTPSQDEPKETVSQTVFVKRVPRIYLFLGLLVVALLALMIDLILFYTDRERKFDQLYFKAIQDDEYYRSADQELYRQDLKGRTTEYINAAFKPIADCLADKSCSPGWMRVPVCWRAKGSWQNYINLRMTLDREKIPITTGRDSPGPDFTRTVWLRPMPDLDKVLQLACNFLVEKEADWSWMYQAESETNKRLSWMENWEAGMCEAARALRSATRSDQDVSGIGARFPTPAQCTKVSDRKARCIWTGHSIGWPDGDSAGSSEDRLDAALHSCLTLGTFYAPKEGESEPSKSDPCHRVTRLYPYAQTPAVQVPYLLRTSITTCADHAIYEMEAKPDSVR
ncbi:MULTISPECIES: caspase domain-containing protein [unclassified Bradyrhizobium]|uniref:caspase family protein n=1 Tax=unclassified Bradyrhizobium TaxID=2631580 RepID=UPI002916D2B6|nr:MULTISPECIES: caspase family protein [unclassified Bradyrhizobium]